MSKVLIDVGSTYFKVATNKKIEHHFRNFDQTIYEDLLNKSGHIFNNHNKEDIHICSSANGGLSTLIIGLTESFSVKYAGNIAYNSGINIIQTLLNDDITTKNIPNEPVDVVIIAGGIDNSGNRFSKNLIEFLEKLDYENIVYVGDNMHVEFLTSFLQDIVILPNIIDRKLKMHEDDLKDYLTNLYADNIIGKEDIKELYNLTTNQIYSTPYIVNRSLPMINTKLNVVDPFIVIDIGGATTDIHYSKESVRDNIITENEYDRLVFKKLGVYKSMDSLVFSAKNNEFVYELLAHLNTTEDMLDKPCKERIKLLMQLSIFLALYKISHMHQKYLNIKLESLNSIVLTGGITKVLNYDEIEDIVAFFYKKIVNFDTHPQIIVDNDYIIWTLGMETKH